MRRPSALVGLLGVAGCVQAAGRAGADAEDRIARGSSADIEAARDLDQQGVRAFQEGRWVDADRYFRSSYRLGGPSSEVWNVARCRERLDDAQGAAQVLAQYLALPDLSAQDRAEGERELLTLRGRASALTVTTRPAGALVLIDGTQTAGPTPVSVELPPGPHTISVRLDGYVTETRGLEARFGRAVIVALELTRKGRER